MAVDAQPEIVAPDRAPAVRPARTFLASYTPVIEESAATDGPQQLRTYLQVLYKHRRLAALCFGGTLALTGLITVLTPRRYTASTRLQAARQSPIQLPLADNVRRSEDTDAQAQITFVATQVATLQSRDLGARVLGAYRLATADLRSARWEPPPPLAPSEAAGAPRVDPELLDRYMKYLAVSEVRGTDLIEVQFTTPSPDLSAFLARAHTQAYMDANDEARRATDAVAEAFLDRQLADAREQVERADQALAAFAAENPKVAINQEQKVVGARITELSSLLTQAEADRTTLESRTEFLTDPSNDRLAYFLQHPGVEKLRLALLDVRAQQAALKPRLGPNHPQMLELAELEHALAQQLRSELNQDVESVRSQYDASRLREERLRAKLTRQEETSIELGTLGARYDMLKNDVVGARELHASLLKQRLETRVNAALVPPNVRVIERAEVPHRPSRPKIPLNAALGVFSGLVIAIGAAFAREYLDRSLKSSDDVQSLLQLPTLAAIPNFALAREAVGASNGDAASPVPPGADELLVVHDPWSRVAEAFRSMRTVLFANPAAPPPKVILVTSARPGEGKTVASLNLASALAELGARTLLIDADLRHPRCHKALGVADDEGLSSWLGGQIELDALVRTLDVPGLFFLPAGPAPRSPAELVASPRMQWALTLLRERFDFIVLDTPPVLAVTDAAVLARESDGVILVVKGRDTEAEAVRRARDALVLAGASILGVLMNDVGLEWGDSYLYDADYSYGRPRRREGAAR